MKRIIILLGILAVVSLACSANLPDIDLPVERISTSDSQTIIFDEPAPTGDEPARIRIEMGAGKLDIEKGGEGLIEGEIRYNVEQWEPEVSRTGNTVRVYQSSDTFNFNQIPIGDYENNWDLKIGNYPVDLRIEAGAYDGTLDLSGIPITELEIADGASSAEVMFDEPNPVNMEQFSYKTGASSVKLEGLSNANFTFLDFNGGAGSYVLDFSGELQRDADVEIESGVSSLEIVIPEGIKSEIKISGDLVDIETEGSFAVENNAYLTTGEGYKLSIIVKTNVGSLKLIHK